jgi:hypothetical protein
MASLDPCQWAFEIGEFGLGADHRQHAAGRLGEAVANVAATNEPKVRLCCWDSGIRVKTWSVNVASQVTGRPSRGVVYPLARRYHCQLPLTHRWEALPL